jgi:hypothetical protein
MAYKIASFDVHKKSVFAVVADAEGGGEFEFERRRFGAMPTHLRELAEWCVAQGVEEVVMESTAQYWRPVWQAMERYWQPARQQREQAPPMVGAMHLAQAQSNKARRGRKNDFVDAERLLKRLVAQELQLSFVPDREQRLWRTVARRKWQLTRERVRLQNQVEAFLELCHIKLSSVVSDLFGVSARRMLKALSEGERDAAKLAAMADRSLRATAEQLMDALGACAEMDAVCRRILKSYLDQVEEVDKHIEATEKELSSLLAAHQDAVIRLSAVPGLGAHSAQQIVAEIGPDAKAFPTAAEFSSWIGSCPGDNVSAEVSKGHRSPHGHRNLRRLFNQAAQAAVKMKGCIFELLFQRFMARFKGQYNEAIWAVANRIAKLVWKLLHDGIEYEERGAVVSAKAKERRMARMIRELRKAGYHVEKVAIAAANPA